MAMQTERAVLAGGCFWGMQGLIRKMPGVIATRVGYAGGDVPNATYHNHGTHAEAIEITFDPTITSYRALLDTSSRFTIRQRATGRAMTWAPAIARPSFT
jgi:peptide-methionine (S)-S-oxide reductase